MVMRMASAFKNLLISRGLPEMPVAPIISGARRSAVSSFPTSSSGKLSCRDWTNARSTRFPCHVCLSWAQTPARIFSLVSSVKSLRSEEHTSELQSLMRISYAVFCLKKKNIKKNKIYDNQTTNQQCQSIKRQRQKSREK